VDVDTFAVYAPAALGDGEMAELKGRYLASLGSALRAADLTPRGLLAWWWAAGLAALCCLTLRALAPGPDHLGMGWIALAAAASALPAAGGRLLWPSGRRQAQVALRLASQAPSLPLVRGADARLQERLEAVWRQAGRLGGSPQDQLRALEDFCREQAWPDAALLYQRLRSHPAGRRRPPLWRLARFRSDQERVTYTLVEMASTS
jgi:hypothetical protein